MKKKSNHIKFDCLVLAAGRGQDDPMAQEFNVVHKCLLPIKGQPMIIRVLDALSKSPDIGKTLISIENDTVLSQNRKTQKYLKSGKAEHIDSTEKASTSVLAATQKLNFPILVTTADHALLTPEIIDSFLSGAQAQSCDLAVGLVHESVISQAYPNVKRTYLRFNDGGYSGANLFALMTPESLKVIDFWQYVERERKKPWKLISAFGVKPLLKWLTGRLSLKGAFEEASKILDAHILAIVLADAHASIDVDKKSDYDLVETILRA